MKKWVWATLPVCGLVATLWLGAHALREERGSDRARSHSKGPATEAMAEVREPEGVAALPVQAEVSPSKSERHVQTVEAPAVPQDNTPPTGGGSVLRGGSGETAERAGSADPGWVDPLLSAMSSTPPANAAPLARRAGKDASREEQLENLRQRQCTSILDHIRAGLAWLALHQASDGHFSEAASIARCRELGHHPRCTHEPDLPSGDISTTGLALMALVAHRDQDKEGLFEPALAAAARWLYRQQRADGSFAFPGREDYATGTAIALIALGRAAASSGDADLRAAVARGLAHITGDPVHAGFAKIDIGRVAYVAEVVEAARSADVPVPPDLESQLRTFLDRVWAGGFRFRQYPSARVEQPHLYPVGMFTAHVLWKERDAAITDAWREWLVSRPLQPKPQPYSLYYGVRMTIALEGTLSDPWRRWLLEVAAEQAREGPAAGSFPALLGGWWMGPTTREPTFQTAVAVLTLEQALR